MTETTKPENDERDTDATGLGVPPTVTAFIDALQAAFAAFEAKDEDEGNGTGSGSGADEPPISPRHSVFGGLKAEHVLALYQAYRAMTADLKGHQPVEGMFCVVTREALMGMAISHKSSFAVNAVRMLEPAPAYRVKLADLLSLHALMVATPTDETDTPADQIVSYSARPNIGPPPEPPVALAIPQVPPLAQAVPMHPVAMAAATGAPRTVTAQVVARPESVPPVPPIRPAIPRPQAQPNPLVGTEGFVDVAASGLSGLTDDEVVMAVTQGAAMDPSLVDAGAFDPSVAGSSGGQPQAPGQLPVQHPLIAQQMDPRTGAPIGGGVGVGPTPQQLLKMRRNLEGGG